MRSQAPALLPLTAPATPRQQAEHNRQVVGSVQNQLVTVKILDDVFQGGGLPGYVAGDVVGMPKAVATQYVSAGVASYDLDAGPRKKARPIEMIGGAPTAAAGGPIRMKFLRPWGTLTEGDVAGFNADLAHELEVKGIARVEAAAQLHVRTLRSVRDALMGRR